MGCCVSVRNGQALKVQDGIANNKRIKIKRTESQTKLDNIFKYIFECIIYQCIEEKKSIKKLLEFYESYDTFYLNQKDFFQMIFDFQIKLDQTQTNLLRNAKDQLNNQYPIKELTDKYQEEQKMKTMKTKSSPRQNKKGRKDSEGIIVTIHDKNQNKNDNDERTHSQFNLLQSVNNNLSVKNQKKLKLNQENIQLHSQQTNEDLNDNDNNESEEEEEHDDEEEEQEQVRNDRTFSMPLRKKKIQQSFLKNIEQITQELQSSNKKKNRTIDLKSQNILCLSDNYNL